jgi:hypothetical protein
LLLTLDATTIRREDQHQSTEAPEDNVRAMLENKMLRIQVSKVAAGLGVIRVGQSS